jgi:hypothetical protein
MPSGLSAKVTAAVVSHTMQVKTEAYAAWERDIASGLFRIATADELAAMTNDEIMVVLWTFPDPPQKEN